MNPILREAYEQNRVLDAEGKTHEPVPHCIDEYEGRILYELTRQFARPRSIETGMAHGVSSLFFLQAIAEQGGGSHISVDPYQDYWSYVGLETVKRSGYGEFHTYYEERSQIQLPRLEAEKLEVDVAFVDGNHRFEFAFVDF